MKKYRVYKRSNGYVVCELKDMGRGWSPEFLSRHDSREEAEEEVKRLKEREVKDNERND